MNQLRKFTGSVGRTYDAFRTHKKVLSPREFIALTDDQRRNIKTTIIKVGSLGDKDFGSIEVEFDSAVFAVK